MEKINENGLYGKMECACCEQSMEVSELTESDNGELICKDRTKCNDTYDVILNSI